MQQGSNVLHDGLRGGSHAFEEPFQEAVEHSGSRFIPLRGGKTFDQVQGEEASYFEWILRGEFSGAVKRCVRDYLSLVRPPIMMPRRLSDHGNA